MVYGSLWSFLFEFMCYLAVAVMGAIGLFRHRSLVALAWLGCIALHAGQIYFDLKMPGSRFSKIYCFPGTWPRVMSAFLAGMVFYLYRDRIVLSPKWLASAIVVLLGFGVLAPQLKALPLVLSPLGAYVLFYAAFAETPSLRNFASRGDLSYGLYLYAFPVQQLLVVYLGRWLSPLGLFALATAITAAFAKLSWHFVESPFMRMKRSERRDALPSQEAQDVGMRPAEPGIPAARPAQTVFPQPSGTLVEGQI
jgi:peptidoglycan/LPS O-acetylase OafA/YrhL